MARAAQEATIRIGVRTCGVKGGHAMNADELKRKFRNFPQALLRARMTAAQL
jgi:hypothetical protein